MNYVWNFDNVKVGSITMNRWADQQVWTSGFGWIGDRVFQWEACAMSGGWYIELSTGSGRRGGVQGNTFNLPLEIAAAARRLL